MKGWPGEPDMEYDVLMADGEAAANAGKPITDVIFDFGNVLIYWDPVAVMTSSLTTIFPAFMTSMTSWTMACRTMMVSP